MAVSEEDVRHIARLARLGLDPARLQQLVHELNGILAHMEVINAVDPASYEDPGDGRRSAPAQRADEGPPLSLEHPLESFAPEMRDGFFLVPRLATHEASDAGENA